MMPANVWPEIDPRVHAVGVSKLRQMNASFLRALADHVYILQDNDQPLAVLVEYNEYLKLQNDAKKGATE